jgi:dual specificity tyrosine-phosphorylation-regulated kinase 2/3/4
MLDSFTFRAHLCITFELLAANLYEHLKAGGFVGCSLELVRRVARQVLRTLLFLRRLDIVHCDLKPENILLTTPGASAVKVIDFGSSCYSTQRVFT